MKTEIKYAPQNLSEVIYPDAASKLRIQALGTGQLQGHVMLWGPNGTGKTSIARLLIEAIGGVDASVDDVDYDELLAKVDLKLYLRNACTASNWSGQSKFFILLNEFDTARVNLHKLWTAMDKCGDELMVIITTNEPMKVHKSVRSRCVEIHMPALNVNIVLPRAQHILAAEGLVLPDAQVRAYLSNQQHSGDLRKYFALLDELLFLHNTGQPMPRWNPQAPVLNIVKSI